MGKWKRYALEVEAERDELEGRVARLTRALEGICECEDAYDDAGIADWLRIASAALHPSEEKEACPRCGFGPFFHHPDRPEQEGRCPRCGDRPEPYETRELGGSHPSEEKGE